MVSCILHPATKIYRVQKFFVSCSAIRMELRRCESWDEVLSNEDQKYASPGERNLLWRCRIFRGGVCISGSYSFIGSCFCRGSLWIKRLLTSRLRVNPEIFAQADDVGHQAISLL